MRAFVIATVIAVCLWPLAARAQCAPHNQEEHAVRRLLLKNGGMEMHVMTREELQRMIDNSGLTGGDKGIYFLSPRKESVYVMIFLNGCLFAQRPLDPQHFWTLLLGKDT